MDIEDRKLLVVYMRGFNDELGSKEVSEQPNSLSTKAYGLGRIDALIGDDVRSSDRKTDDDILNIIKA